MLITKTTTFTATLSRLFLQLFLFGILLSFAVGLNYLHAWTAPTAAPTNGNVSAPLNTGTTLQGKSGGLTLGSTLDIGSSLTVGGVPGTGPYLIDMDAATPGAFKGIRFPDGSVQTVAGGGSLTAIRSYTSSGTWTKPASLSYVVVEVWGGGGGGKGYIANNGVTGGTSSFGSHMSATGGTGAQSPSGVGSGGDINLTGGGGTAVNSLSTNTYGTGGHGGDSPRGGSGGSGTFGPTSGLAGKVPGGGGGGAGSANGSNQATGGSAGGYAQKRIAAASLGATETITIGAGGAGGAHATANGGAGAAGMVVVYEY